MKKISSNSMMGLAKPSRWTLYKSVILSISMLGLGSATAYAEDHPKYAGLTLEKVALERNGNNDSLVLKNGVKSKLTNNDLGDIGSGLDELKREVADLKYRMDDSLKMVDPSDIVDIFAWEQIAEEYHQKYELLQLMVDPTREQALKYEVVILKDQIDRFIMTEDFAKIGTRLRYVSLSIPYNVKMQILQFMEYPPKEGALRKDIQELSEKVRRILNEPRNDDAKNPMFLLQWVALTKELYWKDELLQLILYPNRDQELKYEVLKLREDVRNRLALLDPEDLLQQLDYLELKSEYDAKTHLLQLINWKKGQFK